jgi:hypothetical protein
MRALAPLVLILAGCPRTGGDCQIDQDCSGSEICARNGECHAPSDVRTIHVTWTIRGMPASSTTCGATPNFYILFSSPEVSDAYGYEPVPCASGLFTIDKLPKRFNAVELGVDGGYSEQAAFDAQGNATFDLAP